MKMLMRSIAVCIFCVVAMPLGQAVSDTDLYLIKAERVTIENEKITIVGSARLKMVVIKDDHDPAHKGHQIWGQLAAMGIRQGGQGYVCHSQT